jgi:hypothetical protein
MAHSLVALAFVQSLRRFIRRPAKARFDVSSLEHVLRVPHIPTESLGLHGVGRTQEALGSPSRGVNVGTQESNQPGLVNSVGCKFEDSLRRRFLARCKSAAVEF